jgi:type IV secretory pathway protease TraF
VFVREIARTCRRAGAQRSADRMRRSTRVWAIAVAALIGIGLIFASFMGRKPLLVWNFTASAPPGLYRVLDRPWVKGDWVALRPEPRVASMLTQYGVLESGRLLIKRVAAVKGDQICRNQSVVTINGRWVAIAKSSTTSGTALPNWGGCRRLTKGEVFLLGEAEASFDGRYFGVSEAAGILGPVRHLGR